MCGREGKGKKEKGKRKEREGEKMDGFWMEDGRWLDGWMGFGKLLDEGGKD